MATLVCAPWQMVKKGGTIDIALVAFTPSVCMSRAVTITLGPLLSLKLSEMEPLHILYPEVNLLKNYDTILPLICGGPIFNVEAEKDDMATNHLDGKNLYF